MPKALPLNFLMRFGFISIGLGNGLGILITSSLAFFLAFCFLMDMADASPQLLIYR